MQGGDANFPPVAAMVTPTFTHVHSAYDPGSKLGAFSVFVAVAVPPAAAFAQRNAHAALSPGEPPCDVYGVSER